MCGRFANHLDALHQWAGLLEDWPQAVETGFNIAPTRTIPAFTASAGMPMRWSLIAPWARQVDSRYATFNARIESIADKPAYRHAWKQSQRCLIPALGYYEWRSEGGRKQPYFVHCADGEPMVFAGIYEPARGPDFPASCAIITRPATPSMADLHPRMPVMLQPGQAGDWFDARPAQAAELAGDGQPPGLEMYAVDTRMNKPTHEGEDCIRALSDGTRHA